MIGEMVRNHTEETSETDDSGWRTQWQISHQLQLQLFIAFENASLRVMQCDSRDKSSHNIQTCSSHISFDFNCSLNYWHFAPALSLSASRTPNRIYVVSMMVDIGLHSFILLFIWRIRCYTNRFEYIHARWPMAMNATMWNHRRRRRDEEEEEADEDEDGETVSSLLFYYLFNVN